MTKLARKSKALRVESLETRDLMAGDVSINYFNGDLNIVERSNSVGAAQAVQISINANGTYRVTGLATLDGSGTSTVDGFAYRDFLVTGNVNVTLGGGNDLVKFAPGGTYNAINIDAGSENIKTKQDDDRIFIDAITTRGGVRIETGLGKDFIGITDALIGNDSFDNLIVDMGAGQDSLDVRGVSRTTQIKGNFNAFMIAGAEADIDAIYMDNVSVWANFSTSTGAGDDFVTMKNTIAGGDIMISTGDNKDQVKLTNVTALDDIWTLMGEGDDLLEITDVSCDRLELYGDGGFDTLKRGAAGNVASQLVSGFERDQILLPPSAGEIRL